MTKIITFTMKCLLNVIVLIRFYTSVKYTSGWTYVGSASTISTGTALRVKAFNLCIASDRAEWGLSVSLINTNEWVRVQSGEIISIHRIKIDCRTQSNSFSVLLFKIKWFSKMNNRFRFSLYIVAATQFMGY